MKNLSYILLASILAACGSNTFESENGTVVTYLRKGNGEALMDSAISFYSLKYDTENGNELFKTPEPTPMRVGGAFSEGRGELFQILPMLKVGDSVSFGIRADSLFSETFRAPRPDSISADSEIKFYVALTEQMTEEAYYKKAALDQKELLESYIDTAQLAVDMEILDAYYAENNIEVTKTKNGIGIQILEEGTGPKPEPGQTVKVDYSGYMLTGEDFDSGTYPFQIYLSQVILGWHEGISELNEGTKATIYIPSPLGYGPRKRSEVIVENSILVFDVTLVEIQK